ncbi:hypothetical protein [Runella aurantiaca]|uniref:Uncharacterized protein n=1 Tax=Runella aurantiaca TaxID=2282308 RepID=A0A369I231_9BACT|nr:hypothetical protein [Runella aurantiaca]RDB02305.1 hypothetical protein DVG78_29570 [Runella aurantiaca]
MSKNTKTTSPKIASEAAKVLSNPNSSATAKQLAGSALSQSNKGNQTGSKMETVASKVLQSPRYSETTKDLAASVLSQSNKKR